MSYVKIMIEYDKYMCLFRLFCTKMSAVPWGGPHLGNTTTKLIDQVVLVVNFIQVAQEKLCFFAIHCNLFLAYIHRCKNPLKFSTQCEYTVTPIGW